MLTICVIIPILSQREKDRKYQQKMPHQCGDENTDLKTQSQETAESVASAKKREEYITDDTKPNKV